MPNLEKYSIFRCNIYYRHVYVNPDYAVFSSEEKFSLDSMFILFHSIGWLICCCASTCCAGVLCAVLWARFIEIPALLTVRDLRSQQNVVEMPLVAVCPPAETVADLFQEKL